MEQGQKGEQFRVLDLALPGADVAAPNKPRLLVLVLAASAGLAGAALVIAEKLDTSFHSVDDLRAFTRVPVLAAIPRIVTARDRRRQQWFLGLATTSMAVALLVAAGLSYRIAHGNETLVRLLMRG